MARLTTKNQYIQGFIFLCLLLLIIFWGFLKYQNDTITVSNNDQNITSLNDSELIKATLGGKEITLEVASSNSKQQLGLMNRKALDEDSGMIFIYPSARPLQFWMKDTLISLDIIFFNTEHKIVNIHEKTTPNQTVERYPSEGSVLFVVELNGGWASKNNVKVGDEIRFTL